LLGVPAAELAHELLELDDVAPELAHLPERLNDMALEAGLRVVEEALTRALARNDEAAPQAEVGRALAGLTRGERVSDVAEEVGYSRRRLGTLVRKETGLAPKEYQRVARFEASRGLLGRRPLADVAAECGYADQGHLARDWSGLAGCPPSTWLREEFPFLRDHESAAAAS
jgi:AraC-like DNA-binding protein